MMRCDPDVAPHPVPTRAAPWGDALMGRLLDVVLFAGLALVAGGIVWTLFTMNAPDVRTRDVAPPPAEDGATPGAVVPVDPRDLAPDAEATAVVPVAPDAEVGGASDAAGDPEADTEADPEGDAANEVENEADAGGDAEEAEGDAEADADGAGPDPTVPAAEAGTPAADDAVTLGRVGYTYVTGGAGACGVTLEAWRHVAVSRELLEAYGCGAELVLTLDAPVAGRERVEVIVGDTMNEAWSRTVNVYVGEDEPALEYGLGTGRLAPVGGP